MLRQTLPLFSIEPLRRGSPDEKFDDRTYVYDKSIEIADARLIFRVLDGMIASLKSRTLIVF